MCLCVSDRPNMFLSPLLEIRWQRFGTGIKEKKKLISYLIEAHLMSSPSFIPTCGSTVLHTAGFPCDEWFSQRVTTKRSACNERARFFFFSRFYFFLFPIKALCLFMLLMTIAWHRDHIQNDKVRQTPLVVVIVCLLSDPDRNCDRK